MVDLATKSLLHDKLRFLITVSGVAFAVTLVFVQVGLFLGLLDNASITIEHIDADLWVTSRNTPNVDFAHTLPRDRGQARALGAGRRARRQPHRLVRDDQPARRAPQEGSLVYALEDFSRWNIPWNVEQGDLADLQARRSTSSSTPPRSSGTARSQVGEYREILGPADEDHRPHQRRPLLHDDADLVHRLRPRADAHPPVAPGQDDVHPRQARARGRRGGGQGRDPRGGCRTTTSTRRRSGRRAPATTGSSRPASA